MWVRIARFEGGEGNWDERIAQVRERMSSGMGGGAEMPVKRGLMLADRENSRGANVMFCETEDDLRKVDEFMNNMTIPGGGGTRSSVEMYEVVVDSDAL
jgi:hypothetical protein